VTIAYIYDVGGSLHTAPGQTGLSRSLHGFGDFDMNRVNINDYGIYSRKVKGFPAKMDCFSYNTWNRAQTLGFTEGVCFLAWGYSVTIIPSARIENQLEGNREGGGLRFPFALSRPVEEGGPSPGESEAASLATRNSLPERATTHKACGLSSNS
jgi:hypothetical protein